MFISYSVGSIFLTIYFKHFDFTESFDLNSNPKSLFERSSISDFSVYCSMCIAYLIDQSANAKICSIWINSNNFTTKLFLPLIVYFAYFIFKIYVSMTIFINFYSKFLFRKVKIKSFVLNTVLSMQNFSFKCNLQCTYNILFTKTVFVRV